MTAATVHSRLYSGQIRHRRHRDGQHAFTYPITLLYVDLDETGTLFTDVPFWSARRPAVGWLREKDYLANVSGDTLRQRVNNAVFQATGKYPAGPVRLLTHPRYMGFGMNPISCFYCFKPDGISLQYLVAEVTNTPWRERIAYVLPCDPANKKQHVRFAKQMHVSPFNPMNMDYLAYFNAPEQLLYLHLENRQDSECITDATLTLHEQPVTRQVLLRLLWQFPLQAVQVAAGIYWQALRLWLRGARFHHHSPLQTRIPTSNTVSAPKEIQP